MNFATKAITVSGVALLSLMGVQSAQAAFEERTYNCENNYLEDAVECGENALKAEKSRLNKIYMQKYRTLSTSQKQQMDQEQIAWLKTRDQKCEFTHDGPMNNMVVWQMIAADLCVANETQKRSKYFAQNFVPAKLSKNADDGFKKVKTTNGGTMTHYQGTQVVNGSFIITDPDDDYSPCSVCFSVSDKDAHKIPREAGDDRDAWFGFDNGYHNQKTRGVGALKLRSDKCYEQIDATIKIKNYKADRAETVTVDTTTLVDIISMDKPKITTCQSNF